MKTQRTIVTILLALGTLLTCAAPLRAEDSPSQVFRAYRAAVKSAKTLQELYPFLSAMSRSQAEVLSDADKVMKLSEMQLHAPDRIMVKSEKIKGDTAKLAVEGLYEFHGLRRKCDVVLVKEEGAWKIDREAWE